MGQKKKKKRQFQARYGKIKCRGLIVDFLNNFIYLFLFLIALGLHYCVDISIVVSGSYSVAAAHGLFISVASFVAEFWGLGASALAAHGFSNCGSWTREHRLNR